MKALRALRSKKVFYERGASGGLCLWPHTSVNPDEAFERAVEATRSRAQIAELCAHAQCDTLVPRQHYVKTGTLRYAEVRMQPADDLESFLQTQPKLDGTTPDLHLRIFLPRDERQGKEASAKLRDVRGSLEEGMYVAIAPPPQHALTALADLLAWKWVKENTPELSGDRFGREEVSRQMAASERRLEDRLRGLTNLAMTSASPIEWYFTRSSEKLRPGRELLDFLAKECNQIYRQAPWIRNELINRRVPSSAAVAARTKLVDAMGTAPA
jgi:hypothetical protein